MKLLHTLLIILLVSINGFGQVSGVSIDFNDGNIDGWIADHPHTFQLSSSDSSLKIIYTRDNLSDMWDNFNFTPSDVIDPIANPIISLRIKSDVSSQLTFKPIYSNGSDDWLQQNILGDNLWHDYNFQLINYSGSTIVKLYIYLDGGTSIPKQGTVLFDDFKIGLENVEISLSDLIILSVDSTSVKLDWKANYESLVDKYKIYRSEDSVSLNLDSSIIDSVFISEYIDSNVTSGNTYFYQIIAEDINRNNSLPSNIVKIKKGDYSNSLRVWVSSVNSENVGKYENLESILNIENADYNNPYNPNEIDVRASFISPNGKEWNVFGFYDNFKNAKQWKVKFSPNEVGEWSYFVKVINNGDSAISPIYNLSVSSSEHHGWIRQADKNPFYFQHDDGTSFYGVAAFYPWNINNGSNGLELLENSGGNLFGYWNIMYDDNTILESMSSGLGKYDQNKAGRIDQLLGWAKDRKMKMLFSIWPHDLISETVWAHQWHNNPYNSITDVNHFFSDSLAWEYQKRQYRYIIARWGNEIGLGIFEIVNEINGTDGWQNGYTSEGTNWVKKVSDYFRANDPYHHLITASQSGGKYWKEGYENVDVANAHLYETSWTKRYSSNAMRSSLYIYGKISRNFRSDFTKPALMGEAGYLDTYGNYAVPSNEYTELYHNALWITWANGNASTPIWWDFTNKNIFSSDVLQQMKSFSKIVGKIDYSSDTLSRISAIVPKAPTKFDVYAIAGDSLGFGWIREERGRDIRGTEISLTGLNDTLYTVRWFDTWKGEFLREYLAEAQNGILTTNVPISVDEMGDMAFIFRAVDKNYTNLDNDFAFENPEDFVLEQNYPNPFNPTTHIVYNIKSNGFVSLIVYDVLGREVVNLVNKYQTAGRYVKEFNGTELSSGMYVYVLKYEGKIKTKKMLLVK